jgi:hypothetical protein
MSLMETSATCGNLEAWMFREAFRKAQHAVELLSAGFHGLPRAAATTLIVAAELPDRFLIGYVGDGAIAVLRGNLQWSINLLFPQTGVAGGMTRCLSSDGGLSEPAVIDLPKSWPDGGIILIGTDGALVAGKALETARTIVGEIRAKATGSTHLDQHQVLRVLRDWVQDRITTDDNRSLGILISDAAVRLWQSQKSSAQPPTNGANHVDGNDRSHGPS